MDTYDKYKKLILDATQYQGENQAERRVISASGFGDEITQLYFRWKYGVMENEAIGQNTIGSLVHKGMEQICKDKLIPAEIEMKYTPPGSIWGISGTADILDAENSAIIDIKVTKEYTLKQVVQLGRDHRYVWQVNVYRYLAKKVFGKDYTPYIMFFLKDGGQKNGKIIPDYSLIEVDVISDYVIEKKFFQIVQELEDIIEGKKELEKCENVWLRKVGSKTVPMRCQKYCSYSNVCPFYNPKIETELAGW